MITEQIVTVFGGSRAQDGDADYREARELGRTLAEKGFAVCTGGYGGVMAAVSRGAKDGGGKTYGVTADSFRGAKANEWIDVEVRVKDWKERLFELIKMGDGLVACKGGSGTLAELAVAWEMMNKSVTPVKPFVALGEFWKPILKQVNDASPDDGGAETSSPLLRLSAVTTAAQAVNYLSERLKPKR